MLLKMIRYWMHNRIEISQFACKCSLSCLNTRQLYCVCRHPAVPIVVGLHE